jgi:hypothetical protein
VQRGKLNELIDSSVGLLQDWYEEDEGCQLKFNGIFHY